MTARNFVVVTAGLSQPSSTRLLGDRLAAATQRALLDQGIEVGVDVIELRDYARDITNQLLTRFPSETLRAAITNTVHADGLIVVSPIFSASYSGLFKSFFDVLDEDSLAGKPVLIAATGGTERHSLALEHALRPLFSYLRAVVVPTAVYAASSDWGRVDDGAQALARRIARAAGELADQVARNRPAGPLDPFDDVVPFDQLLVAD